MICDIPSSIEIGVRAKPSLRFIAWPEILASEKMPEATRNDSRPMAVNVLATSPKEHKPYRTEQALVPDALFGLEYTANSTKQYRFFALEADRHTEPVSRSTLGKSSLICFPADLSLGAARDRGASNRKVGGGLMVRANRSLFGFAESAEDSRPSLRILRRCPERPCSHQRASKRSWYIAPKPLRFKTSWSAMASSHVRHWLRLLTNSVEIACLW
jgi:hypothetical protein